MGGTNDEQQESNHHGVWGPNVIEVIEDHGGAGAVGNALLALGRAMGLEVVATASAKNLDLLRESGTIAAVDYRAPDYARRLRQAAGDGFDAAFDGVGLRSFGLSFRLLAAGKIQPKITERVPLEDAARAHEMIDAGAVRGRLALV